MAERWSYLAREETAAIDVAVWRNVASGSEAKRG
jgi:hypothetical protein